MLPRELSRRLEARSQSERERQEAAWERALLITNHIRGALDADPLTLDDLREGAEEGGEASLPTAEDWAAAAAALDKRRTQTSTRPKKAA